MLRRWQGALLLGWLALGSTARAQYLEPPVVPDAPPPAPTPADEAPPVASEAASEADVRLDEIEQMARIAARKHELLEEEQAKRAKEAPVVTADDKGFGLKLPDNAYVLRIRALLQVDGRFFLGDDGLQASDTFLIRRFRPSIEGTLFSLVDYRLLPEFAGTVTILDAYADIHPWPWLRVRIGKYKGPIGLERLQSDADLPLLERSLDQNLSSQREIGVQLWGDVAGGIAQYTLAILDGAIDGTAGPDADINHAKDFAARLFFLPFRSESLRALGSLGIGVAGSLGDRKGRLPAQSGLGSFRTAGQSTFFQYLAPATDTTGATTTFSYQRESHLNPQLYYYYENIGLLAEYLLLRQGVQRGGATRTLTHQSAHATLSYVLGGRVGWDGVTPDLPFDAKKATWGALELAARLAWLEVDAAAFGAPSTPGSPQFADPTKSARSARSWAAGLTWVPRRSVHLAVNFERTTFAGGAGTAAAPADRKTENVFIGRAQVNF